MRSQNYNNNFFPKSVIRISGTFYMNVVSGSEYFQLYYSQLFSILLKHVYLELISRGGKPHTYYYNKIVSIFIIIVEF